MIIGLNISIKIMVAKSLKIKNVSYYFWNNIIYLNKFDDKMLKINKREN